MSSALQKCSFQRIVWEAHGDTSTPLCGSTSVPPSVVKPKASESPEWQNFRPFNRTSSWVLLESEPGGLNKDRQLALFPGPCILHKPQAHHSPPPSVWPELWPGQNSINHSSGWACALPGICFPDKSRERECWFTTLSVTWHSGAVSIPCPPKNTLPPSSTPQGHVSHGPDIITWQFNLRKRLFFPGW